MPLQHLFDAQSNLVRIRASGVVTERDFIETLSALAREPDGRALHSSVLTTFSGDTSISDIDMAALKRIRAHLEALLKAHPGPAIKSAWVTGDARSVAVLRLWQALVDANPAVGRHIKIFSAEDDALAWLQDSVD